MDGSSVNGYQAKFICDSDGIDIKMEIEPLINIEVGDWVSIWITTFEMKDIVNIKIGIGSLIGNEEDVIFSFEYANNGYLDLSIQKSAWIGSSQSTTTQWIFYDYLNSSTCDMDIINQYNISTNKLNYKDEYKLKDMSDDIDIPSYLWKNKYLMFDLSSTTETWIEFEMDMDKSIIIEYGKHEAKGACDSKGDTSYYIVIDDSNESDDYEYCTKYGNFDLSMPWKFWIYWNNIGGIEIGNGELIGQSVITKYDVIGGVFDIENVKIGCDSNEIVEWTFYTQQQRLQLLNTTFLPDTQLLFIFNFNENGILQSNVSIHIKSHSLNINYLLDINFVDNTCYLCNNMDDVPCILCKYENGGVIDIEIPDYSHIQMHSTFSTQYEIHVNSSELLLSPYQYVLMRSDFMNLTIDFVTELVFGDKLQLYSYFINNDKITQNASFIQLTCPTLGINSILSIYYLTNTCLICNQYSDYVDIDCYSCYDGIPIINQGNTTQTYILSISSNDTLLTNKQYQITFKSCDTGSGLVIDGDKSSSDASASSGCFTCPQNYVNLLNNDNVCHSCSGSQKNNDNGYDCTGSSDILIDYNYWISISGFTPNSDQLFPEDQPQQMKFVSSHCPQGHCCLDKNGCYYDVNISSRRRRLQSDSSKVCALNRDSTTPLCGGCLDGYSQVYGSTSCQKCHQHNYWYLLIAIAIGLLFAIGISFIMDYNEDKDEKHSFELITEEMESFKYSEFIMRDYKQGLWISLFRPITYFYQIMSYILMNYTNTSMYFIMILLQIFALDINIENNANNHGFCFLSDMSSLDEELWLLFLPFCMFIGILSIWIFMQCFSACLLDLCKLQYTPNINSMLWWASLISTGAVFNRMFRILACKQIGELNVHYYAASYQCYDGTWWFALFFIILISIFWFIIWFLLYRMGEYKRQQPSSLYHRSIINAYKDELWYWEFVILSRRFILTFLVTFKYIDENYFNLTLGILLLFYLVIQLKFKPFKYKRINNMETLCLFLLLSCFILINFVKDEEIMAIFVSISLILPLLLFVMRIYSTIKLYASTKFIDGDLNDHQQKKLLAAIYRLPTSRRDIILAIVQKKMPYIDMPDDESVFRTKENSKLIDDATTTGKVTVITSDDENGDTDDIDKFDDAVTSKTGNTGTITDYFKSPGGTPPGNNVVNASNNVSPGDLSPILSEATDVSSIMMFGRTQHGSSTNNNNNNLIAIPAPNNHGKFVRKRRNYSNDMMEEGSPRSDIAELTSRMRKGEQSEKTKKNNYYIQTIGNRMSNNSTNYAMYNTSNTCYNNDTSFTVTDTTTTKFTFNQSAMLYPISGNHNDGHRDTDDTGNNGDDDEKCPMDTRQKTRGSVDFSEEDTVNMEDTEFTLVLDNDEIEDSVNLPLNPQH